ncbi:acetyltransferase [Butyrivibrio proteoclasticus B316]|jgi:acetyltransferase-like isoleucine patch superfamily enzyme|uniref:Acetyltransferase n=2 Tax=Butyrivibrio proteoclasticus TaxID=43305 RepID=E0S0J4_BUTPB|nr:acetyltransferase [Butyrivibrio proteoclasticus B316]
MRSPVLYIKNMLGIAARKIRFGSRFSAGAIQTFDHLHTEIYGNGSIKMGSYNQNRGNLYLVAQNGTLEIGNHCFFNTGCCLTALESIKIGDNCKFGNNLVVVDHDHNYKKIGDAEFISSKIVIGNNVWVGANVTILRGTTIGDDCVIGAGCVIKGNIEPKSKIVQKR